MGQAHFPLQCDLESFEFGQSPVDETQLRTLYEGEFIEELRNLIFIGGTGTGKTHLAIAIAMHAVRERSRVRFFNLVDLANQLEQEKSRSPLLGKPRWSLFDQSPAITPESRPSTDSSHGSNQYKDKLETKRPEILHISVGQSSTPIVGQIWTPVYSRGQSRDTGYRLHQWLFSSEGGRLVERAFGMGPCALSVAVTLVRDRLAGAES